MSNFCSHKGIRLFFVFIVTLLTLLNNSIIARPNTLPFHVHAQNKDFSIISKIENQLNLISNLYPNVAKVENYLFAWVFPV